MPCRFMLFGLSSSASLRKYLTANKVGKFEEDHLNKIHNLKTSFRKLLVGNFISRKPAGSPNMQLSLCVHSVCHCGKTKPDTDIMDRLTNILIEKGKSKNF